MEADIGGQRPAILLRFTPRERRVIEGLMRAQTVKEIARDLGISYETAKDALKSVYVKAEVHSARALMLKVLDRNFLRPEWPAEALQFFRRDFAAREAMEEEMRRLARQACPSALALVAALGPDGRAKLTGSFTAQAPLAPLALATLAAREVWRGFSQSLFASPVLPAQCPCLAAPFHGAGEGALIVVRPPRSLAFSESETAALRLIALLAEAKNRALAFAVARAAHRLSRASIA